MRALVYSILIGLQAPNGSALPRFHTALLAWLLGYKHKVLRGYAWEACVMSFVFDILHLTIAIVLSVIGMDYQRDDECTPVQFQHASYSTHADSTDDTADVSFAFATECGTRFETIHRPVL